MATIINVRECFPVRDSGDLAGVIAFVHSHLQKLNIKKKLLQKAELLTEETVVMFRKRAPEDARLSVQIRRFLGDVVIQLSMQGAEFDPFSGARDGTEDELSEDAIRAVLLRSHGEKYKYRHKNGINSARILTGQSEQQSNTVTFLAIVCGLLCGILFKLVLPQPAMDALSGYLLDPIRTVFMNALKIVIAPVIFFSIVTCFSQFRSLADFGKLGAKVVGMYFLTTIFAIAVGIGVFSLISPGEWGFALSERVEAAPVTMETDVAYGILPMLVDIVPSNFLSPFLESNTLQLIFLAVLCGIAVGMIGQYSSVLIQLFEACNSLFLTITAIIAKFIPVAVFASVVLMVADLGGDSLLSVLSASLTVIFALFLMLCLYGLLILLMGKLNPLTYYKKIRDGMLTSFSLSSSSAAMPTNLRICTDKLGISPKVAAFSIPLGATINMDGFCIYLSVICLFLAKAYGVSVSASDLVSMIVTIILLSLGAPGVPGAGLICVGIVLKSIHVPLEALGLIIAVTPILDMFITMSNATGDMTAALIVAKSEALLDIDVYNKGDA